MRRVGVVVAGLVLAVALSGCATRYQEMGATGGVSAAQMTDDVWRITARGNLYTDAGIIQDYVLLKAAETTVAAGRTHFAIVGKHEEARGEAPGLYTRQAFGTTKQHFAYGLIGSGRSEIGEALMIRILPLSLSDEDKAEAIDARQVVANVGRRVVRPGE